MSFFSPRGRSARRGRSPRPTRRLQIESLEDRCLLSAVALDTTFGGGGIVTTPIGGGTAIANAVAVQIDGKIVAAGSGTISHGYGAFALARYNASGTLDSSFGSGGTVTTNFVAQPNEGASGLALQSDGKLVAAGNVYVKVANKLYSDFALVRYNTNGSLDTTFNGSGKLLTSFGSGDNQAITAVAVQADGKIVVAGYVSGPTIAGQDFALARYNANGTLDTTFGSGGMVLTDFGGTDQANGMLIQPDGRIVAAGYTFTPGGGIYGGLYQIALARYNTNGSLDTSLGTGGKVITTFGGGADAANAVVIQPADNKLVVGGYANAPNGFAFETVRYLPNGALDTTFNGTGAVVSNIAADGSVQARSLGVQSNGSIVVAGFAWYPSDVFVLMRYTSAGVLDTTFGSGGITTTAIGAAAHANAVAIQGDGKIVAAGYGNVNQFALARYQGDAALPAFSSPTANTAADTVTTQRVQPVLAEPTVRLNAESTQPAEQNAAKTLAPAPNASGALIPSPGHQTYEYLFADESFGLMDQDLLNLLAAGV